MGGDGEQDNFTISVVRINIILNPLNIWWECHFQTARLLTFARKMFMGQSDLTTNTKLPVSLWQKKLEHTKVTVETGITGAPAKHKVGVGGKRFAT